MKLFKNRIVRAGICIVVAFVLVICGINAANAQQETITVVSVANTIRKGDLIEADDLATITVGKQSFPQGYAINPEDIADQYALADLYPGDFVLKSKVSPELSGSDAKLLKLDGKRGAISVLIKDFARGVSDKIVGGDIVSCIVTVEDDTDIPVELTYMEVVATTTPRGIDKDNATDVPEENLATVTLMATPLQAALLAKANLNADIHLMLVYRGTDEKSKEFLDIQEQVLQDVLANQSETSEADQEDKI